MYLKHLGVCATLCLAAMILASTVSGAPQASAGTQPDGGLLLSTIADTDAKAHALALEQQSQLKAELERAVENAKNARMVWSLAKSKAVKIVAEHMAKAEVAERKDQIAIQAKLEAAISTDAKERPVRYTENHIWFTAGGAMTSGPTYGPLFRAFEAGDPADAPTGKKYRRLLDTPKTEYQPLLSLHWRAINFFQMAIPGVNPNVTLSGNKLTLSDSDTAKVLWYFSFLDFEGQLDVMLGSSAGDVKLSDGISSSRGAAFEQTLDAINIHAQVFSNRGGNRGSLATADFSFGFGGFVRVTSDLEFGDVNWYGGFGINSRIIWYTFNSAHEDNGGDGSTGKEEVVTTYLRPASFRIGMNYVWYRIPDLEDLRLREGSSSAPLLRDSYAPMSRHGNPRTKVSTGFLFNLKGDLPLTSIISVGIRAGFLMNVGEAARNSWELQFGVTVSLQNLFGT